MKRMLINATQQEELRVALVDGQKLYDLDIETLYTNQKKSNIYKGKITRIEPSLEAVFVDYGGARHGFLPFKEISKEYLTGSTSVSDKKLTMKDMLEVGQEVLVQIEKEERGNKGAALTTYISLAGRFLVLMPNNPRAGGVSRRIQGDDRKELRDILDNLDLPAEMGIIVRTAGVGRSQEELQWDLEFLLQVWEAISEEYRRSTPQRLIYQESNIIVRALRDYLRPDIGQIIIDNEQVYQQATEFMKLIMPNAMHKLKLYQENIPLFTHYQIEGQIETAYQHSVSLPSGGSIVIDYTEALVSIDINSSKSTKAGDVEETAYQTNLEAADEIARQMRLRDFGGLIVIDFIDMLSARHRREVEKRLNEATKADRARVQIGRISSKFGLLEMSRQRLRASIDEASHQVCPRCKGQGSIRGIQSQALSILRLIEEEALKGRTKRINAELPVSIATYLLNEKRAVLRSIEQRYNVDVILVPNPDLLTPDYYLERLRDNEVDEDCAETPSYKMAKKYRSDVEEAVIVHQPTPVSESPAVSGLMPKTPAPIMQEEQTKTGLSALFSKVVALFKENAQTAEIGEKEIEEAKKSHKSSRQESTPARKTRAKAENKRKRNERKVREEVVVLNERVEDEAQSHQVESVAIVSEESDTLNGRTVRKGRPRDVHAVRGQGKANFNPELATSQNEALTSNTLTSDGEEDILQTLVNESSDTQLRAPGLVSFLSDEPVSTNHYREANAQMAEVISDEAQPSADNPLVALNALGQSVWYDNIQRKLLQNGELATLIREDKISGVTSNPAIFQKAMSDSTDYDDTLKAWVRSGGRDVREGFYLQAISDIQNACDLLKDTYERTNGMDGMVSLEVSPDLAYNAQATIAEALNLFKRVNRPNAMIKVPATEAGLEVIRFLTYEGVNVNATLLFSVERYQAALEAYIGGLKDRLWAGRPLDNVSSVASFFISRVDSAVDALLDEEYAHLRGRCAIANAQLAYQAFLARTAQADWQGLLAQGAKTQRLLWASTGCKNPAYSDVRYVDMLIGKDTVNTIAPATLSAFKEHGRAQLTLERDLDHIPTLMKELQVAGIDLKQITQKLEKDGVLQFEQAFAKLLSALQEKMSTFIEASDES